MLGPDEAPPGRTDRLAPRLATGGNRGDTLWGANLYRFAARETLDSILDRSTIWPI